MNLGYRVFLVEGDTVKAVSRKAFDGFYLRNMNSFPQYAGQVLIFAAVIYRVAKRKPTEIVRLDCQRICVNEAGGVDMEFENGTVRLVADMLDAAIGASATEAVVGGPVVNASARFDDRRKAYRYPNLSGPAHRRILEILFG